MQAHSIEASIRYMEQELLYTPEQTATALETGLPMLIQGGARTFVQDLQSSLGSLSYNLVHTFLHAS